MPESKSAGFPNGYITLGDFPAPGAAHINVSNDLVAMTRNTSASHKVGNDTDRLLWVGDKEVLLMHSPRNEGTYPDNGCSAEIYTSSGDPYIELELLTQLENLAVGESFDQVVTYTLLPRTEATPEAEVAKTIRFLIRQAHRDAATATSISDQPSLN